MKVIEFHNVFKDFKLYHQRATTLRERVVKTLKEKQDRYTPFRALNGITFTVKEGEALGIIGENGSGKSTILKLISRILRPNRGNILVKGRVSALLELGAGFNPELTGAENIFLNGTILGLTRRQIRERYPEIVEFAELGEFIENPVNFYSSGMYMRLGFAVAVNVNPEILLIDEILTVGDQRFQEKCKEKIYEFKERGKTIVFVSHSMTDVEYLCDRVIWLKEGTIAADGPTKEVIAAYLEGLHLPSKPLVPGL